MDATATGVGFGGSLRGVHSIVAGKWATAADWYMAFGGNTSRPIYCDLVIDD